MSHFVQQLSLAGPHFILVFVGYLLAASGRWQKSVSDALAVFVFSIAVPALLVRLMSDPSRLPPFQWRLLAAFFGGCLVTIVIGRLAGAALFRLDGVQQSVFALGGVFSNNVLLGIPLAKVVLGEQALPYVALVIVFNSLTLWTVATVSVEWARHGELSARGFAQTARKVLTTPVIVGVLAGAAVGTLGIPVPSIVDEPLRLTAEAAVPLAPIVVGMGLAQHGWRTGWQAGVGITTLKLVVQPLVVPGEYRPDKRPVASSPRARVGVGRARSLGDSGEESSRSPRLTLEEQVRRRSCGHGSRSQAAAAQPRACRSAREGR